MKKFNSDFHLDDKYFFIFFFFFFFFFFLYGPAAILELPPSVVLLQPSLTKNLFLQSNILFFMSDNYIWTIHNWKKLTLAFEQIQQIEKIQNWLCNKVITIYGHAKIHDKLLNKFIKIYGLLFNEKIQH